MRLHIFFKSMLLMAISAASAQNKKTDILILGSDHLSQIYKSAFIHTDVLTRKSQEHLSGFTAMVMPYRPDAILIEELPEDQHRIDSLYQLFLQDRLAFENLPDGRSEIFQLAFRIGKAQKIGRILCANAPGGTSQGILDNGENIELYRNEGNELRKIVTDKYDSLQKGTLTLRDYLIFLNQPETIRKIYHLRYITPARVTNGKFKNPDAMVDTAFINPKYIGAELTSVFRNRDYKIYSNIVTANMKMRPKRMLLIIGVAHIGSLQSMFRDDDEFLLHDATEFVGRR